jgi:uncharacterized protein (TIGR02246 family)
MSARHKEIVEAVNAAFARNDIEAFLEYCAEDFVWTIVGDETVAGKEAIRKWMGSVPSEPPVFSVADVVAEGDLVVTRGDMTMKDQGTTGAYAFCDVWRFRGDQLVELRAFVIKTDRHST